MSKSLFIISLKSQSGKSIVALGFMEQLLGCRDQKSYENAEDNAMHPI
jgi:BioD-like phosphotransacetylase family protein